MTQAPDSTQPLQEVDVYIQQSDGEERITYIRKTPRSNGEQPQVTRKVGSFFLYLGYLALSWLLLFLPSSAATAALPIVTVTIVPKTQPITTTQTVQLPARVFPPLTLSQSQTAPTTGHGHQNATKAKGSITFYNGLFQSQTIAAGTILTARSGIQITTDQLALLPAGNPPSYGQTTIAAHALNAGASGNISAYSINQLCCMTAVKAVNTTAFHGGMDERDFSTVATQDVNKLSTQLRETLHTSMQAAFGAELTPTEALIPPLCSETVSPDHQPGAAATIVTVTVSESCSAGAYEKNALQEQASHLLTTTATEQLGTGYRLVGDTNLTINQATIQNNKAMLVITSSGTWVYHFSQAQEQELLHLIAGKPKRAAISLLIAELGIQRVHIPGIADNAILPTDPGYIQILVS